MMILILALLLFGIAIWNFVVGLWIVGILATVLGIASLIELWISYNEDVFL
jgi:hypothetical protein